MGQARQYWRMAQARDWVAILDHSDMFMPSRLERQITKSWGSGRHVFSYAGYRGGSMIGTGFCVPSFRGTIAATFLHDLLTDLEIQLSPPS